MSNPSVVALAQLCCEHGICGYAFLFDEFLNLAIDQICFTLSIVVRLTISKVFFARSDTHGCTIIGRFSEAGLLAGRSLLPFWRAPDHSAIARDVKKERGIGEDKGYRCSIFCSDSGWNEYNISLKVIGEHYQGILVDD